MCRQRRRGRHCAARKADVDHKRDGRFVPLRTRCIACFRVRVGVEGAARDDARLARRRGRGAPGIAAGCNADSAGRRATGLQGGGARGARHRRGCARAAGAWRTRRPRVPGIRGSKMPGAFSVSAPSSPAHHPTPLPRRMWCADSAAAAAARPPKLRWIRWLLWWRTWCEFQTRCAPVSSHALTLPVVFALGSGMHVGADAGG